LRVPILRDAPSGPVSPSSGNSDPDFPWLQGLRALRRSASRLRLDGRRISLSPALRGYPRTTIAWDPLAYPVPPSVIAVGTWYRNINLFAIAATPAGAFLGSLGSLSSCPPGGLLMASRAVVSLFVPLGVLGRHPTGLNRTIHVSAQLPFSVLPAFNVVRGGAGILTSFPSPTPFRLGLGTD
jgi:hypothetical protein